jgi:hypothetical protein
MTVAETRAEWLRLLLQRETARGFTSLRGAVLRGSLPIAEPLLNELIRGGEHEGDAGLVRPRALAILAGNRLRLDVDARVSFITKRLSIDLEVGQPTGLPGAPQLEVRFPATFATLLTRAIRARFDPAGVFLEIGPHTVTIRLREFLARIGAPEVVALLPWIKALAFRSEPGVLWVDFEVSVP